MARVLYLSHDGLMEPLSQSQVWQYLRNLSGEHEITLLTFEKSSDWQDFERRKALIKEVESAGVRWFPMPYHKRPKVFASALDLAICFLVSVYLIIRYRIKIVHVRNAPFTLVGLFLKIALARSFIFDMRGFWADERVDGGLWKKNSLLYRINKWLEKYYFLKADTIVVLTHAAVNEIKKFKYLESRSINIEIIPTCANLGLFSTNGLRPQADVERFTLGYLGNVGTWYLFDPALDFFKTIRELKPKARMIFINDGQHEYIRSRLKAHGIADACVEIKRVAFKDSPGEIRRMDAVVFFIKPVFSKKSSMPTKLGELLGCGVPCITNTGIGDVDQVLNDEKVGVLLSDFKSESMKEAAGKLLDLVNDTQIGSRCVKAARKYFSLENGVKAYDLIYKRLSN